MELPVISLVTPLVQSSKSGLLSFKDQITLPSSKGQVELLELGKLKNFHLAVMQHPAPVCAHLKN